MADEKLAKMLRIASDPKHIRNIATSAHIHHGKTAFTDNLLAAAGLMSEKAAGDLDQGMATWQHADEQERLLTVDAANVSMAHTFEGEDYLINLIDTPGHVDFGGNVTRAMRAVDGTIVLVCASEGIMPQTETVLRQALRERVKPILFINKVDRLIKEMMFTPEQMQERFKEIVVKFNRLIEAIAEPEFREKWKVDIMNGSVAFGSARDNWAMSVPFMKKKNVSFKDILNIYNKTEEEREKWVWDNAALYEVMLDAVIKHLPNPAESQVYRIPKIWRGDLDSEFGKSLMTCNPNGEVAFVITRILIDPKGGREISAGRLYSGTIKPGMEVYLSIQKAKQRIQNVYIYRGIKHEMIDSIQCGNIIALTGIKSRAGETITLEPQTPFEEMKHIFEPVITKAIKPEKPGDLPKMIEVLRQVSKEDPSIKIEINEETGESLMSGMGELHLEIIENRIKTEKNMNIITSPPIITFRETITKESPEAEGKTPNKHNRLYFKAEPLTDEIYQAMKDGKIPEGRVKKKDDLLWNALEEAGMDSKTSRKVRDIFKGNMFIDETRGVVYINEIMEMVLDMFEDVMSAGPLAKEACNKVKISLVDVKLHEDAIHRGPAQMYPAVRDGIRGAMMMGNPIMFEPMQILQIDAPTEYTGDVSKLIQNKRGQLLEMDNQGMMTMIKAKMPVAELLGWSSDLRSATGGRGNSSIADQTFERMNSDLQAKVIKQIKDRKGLTDAMLGA
jgi:elongation factor 2